MKTFKGDIWTFPGLYFYSGTELSNIFFHLQLKKYLSHTDFLCSPPVQPLCKTRCLASVSFRTLFKLAPLALEATRTKNSSWTYHIFRILHMTYKLLKSIHTNLSWNLTWNMCGQHKLNHLSNKAMEGMAICGHAQTIWHHKEEVKADGAFRASFWLISI